MRINHNIAALNTYRQLNSASNAQMNSMEKLSSGLRINKAGDDAAGLSISEKMRSQIRGLDQAAKNAQDGISMIQTAEGALNETHSILQRMRELGVQAGNDTNNDADREAINDELKELKTEIDRISKTTKFNEKELLSGNLSTKVDSDSDINVGVTLDTTVAITKVDVSKLDADDAVSFTYDETTSKLTATLNGKDQTITITAPTAGAETTYNFNELGFSFSVSGAPTTDINGVGNAIEALTLETASNESSAKFLIGTTGGFDETLAVDFKKIDSSTLGTDGGTSLAAALTNFENGMNKTNAEALVSTLDRSIKDVSKQRSLLGAAQNRLDHTINNLNTSSENLTAAESRIRDVDMAKEMMEQTKNSILSQAAQAMLAQANQQPQGVLQLLR